VVIARWSFSLSERVLHPSSDLRGRERLPDGLPKMVHMPTHLRCAVKISNFICARPPVAFPVIKVQES